MNKIFNYIEDIINDLINPNIKLKDVLLKVQVLAYELKNEKLKNWVDCEINGYGQMDIEKFPKYRVIQTSVHGNLIQNFGFGSFSNLTNYTLPIEHLDEKIVKRLSFHCFNNPVSEIENLSTKEKGILKVSVPVFIYPEIEKIIESNCNIHQAWQQINISSLVGILESIKSYLLKFILELKQEMGDNNEIDITKLKIDKLFDKIIANDKNFVLNISNTNIRSDKLNYINGNDNIQEINS
ncbi:MAG: hypothetical protein WC358_07395 [Ignavibacteria bacterium]|jgi:hypothetical protein